MKAACLCPTYNRYPHQGYLLEEAVQCFIDQDYNDKILIVVNDCREQFLGTSDNHRYANIHIVNTNKRFSSLGVKRNFLCQLAIEFGADVLFPWDDDDLHLPQRISQAMNWIKQGYHYFNPQRYYWLDRTTLHTKHNHGVSHNASAFTKVAYAFTDNYPDITVGEDADMDHQLKKLKRTAPSLTDDPKDWQYIYRWGVSECHISGLGKPNEAWKIRGEYNIQKGEYEVIPGYRPETQKLIKQIIGGS